jgi:hypothetical protein
MRHRDLDAATIRIAPPMKPRWTRAGMKRAGRRNSGRTTGRFFQTCTPAAPCWGPRSSRKFHDRRRPSTHDAIRSHAPGVGGVASSRSAVVRRTGRDPLRARRRVIPPLHRASGRGPQVGRGRQRISRLRDGARRADFGHSHPAVVEAIQQPRWEFITATATRSRSSGPSGSRAPATGERIERFGTRGQPSWPSV